MNTNNLISKQKAIYAGLKPLLTKEQLLEAMLIWQDKYSQQSGFSARYFSDEVATLTGNAITPKKILINMISELTSNRTHNEDPSELINRYRQEHKRGFGKAFALPELEAFKMLSNKIFGLCSQSVGENARRSVATKVTSLPIDSNLGLQLRSWISDQQTSINASHVEIKDLRHVISLIYGELCLLIGPVKTDAQFATALASLGNNGGAIYSDLFKKML